MRTPFLGPAYVARSSNLADQQLINLYPEFIESKSAKDVGAFYGTPGLDLIGVVGFGPIRGMIFFEPTNTLYLMSGGELYRVDSALNGFALGSVVSQNGPVSFIANTRQIAVFDGSAGYLIDTTTNAVTTLTLPFSNPTVASYQDGFGLVVAGGTQSFFQSNLNDLGTWQTLNFGTAAVKGDNIVAIAENHHEQWIFKQTSTEVWINAGVAGFAFEILTAAFVETGCGAPFSIARVGNILCWLGQTDSGQATIVAANGYSAQRISTSTIERSMASYPILSDAIAYSYQQEGHVFYVITFPSGNATWVYDQTSSMIAGYPIWHQRAGFSNGLFTRHIGNAFAFGNNLNILGDYANGNLYAYNLDTYTDNGATRKWLRSWRALPKPSFEPVRFHSLQLDLQTGFTDSDTDPQCMLRWSDDGGHRWSDYRIQAVGKIGETAKRVKFNALGGTRKHSGLDRIFELSSTDPFKVALIGADLL